MLPSHLESRSTTAGKPIAPVTRTEWSSVKTSRKCSSTVGTIADLTLVFEGLYSVSSLHQSRRVFTEGAIAREAKEHHYLF